MQVYQASLASFSSLHSKIIHISNEESIYTGDTFLRKRASILKDVNANSRNKYSGSKYTRC